MEPGYNRCWDRVGDTGERYGSNYEDHVRGWITRRYTGHICRGGYDIIHTQDKYVIIILQLTIKVADSSIKFPFCKLVSRQVYTPAWSLSTFVSGGIWNVENGSPAGLYHCRRNVPGRLVVEIQLRVISPPSVTTPLFWILTIGAKRPEISGKEIQ